MLQLSIGLKSGLGLWAVSMGFTAYSSSFETAKPVTSRTIKLDEAQDIRMRYKSLPCLGNLFDNVRWGGQDSLWESLREPKTIGCLSVWWNMDFYDNGNWKGSWNLLWGMRDEAHGMVFSTNIKADEGKLEEDSILYKLRLWGDQWSVSSAIAPSSNEHKKEMDKKDIKKRVAFPDEKLINSSNGWAFAFDSDKICSSKNVCISESPKQTFVHLNWKFISRVKPGQSELTYIHKWVKNMDELYYFNVYIPDQLASIRGYFELNE